MLLKKFRSGIIRCFLVSMTLFLSLIFLVCSSDKYPESYGVYLYENLNPIKKIEYSDRKFFNIGGGFINLDGMRIDLEKLSFSDNNSSISLWFYDPKIVPTELKFGRVNYYTNEIENFDFNTKPIEGKLGLFKIEITQPVEEGIYALYSYNLIKRSTVPTFLWPFLIANKKSKSSYKNEILGKWDEPAFFIDFFGTEFLQNGEIRHNDKKVGNYNFIGYDSLQIELNQNEKSTGKIYFISNELLYIGLFLEAPHKNKIPEIKLLIYRKN